MKTETTYALVNIIFPVTGRKDFFFQRLALPASLYTWQKMAIVALEPQYLLTLGPPIDQHSNVLFPDSWKQNLVG